MSLNEIIQFSNENSVKKKDIKGIQETYFQFLLSKRINDLEALVGLTGIEPNISEDKIQEIYRLYILGGYKDEILYVKKRFKVDPSEKVVRETYRLNLKVGYIDNIVSTSEVISIKPYFTEEEVQKAYKNYLISGKLDSIPKLEHLTGIKPDFTEEEVLRKYEYYLSVEDSDKIVRLREVTKTEFPESLKIFLQTTYRSLVKKGEFYRLKLLKESTGVEPDEETYRALKEYIEKNAE